MRISEIFYSLQGEGTLLGVPSVFIRVSGCNLRCTWCDTPYASWEAQGVEMEVEQIVAAAAAYRCAHVVVTGGEPTIMEDFALLCDRLKGAFDPHITVETAATVYARAPIDLASISPKLSNSTPWLREDGRFAVRHEKQRINTTAIQQWIDQSPSFQLKFVVSQPSDLDEIRAILGNLKDWRPADVLLMPEGVEQSDLAAKADWLAELCKQTGFRFCPRLHVALYGNRRGT